MLKKLKRINEKIEFASKKFGDTLEKACLVLLILLVVSVLSFMVYAAYLDITKEPICEKGIVQELGGCVQNICKVRIKDGKIWNIYTPALVGEEVENCVYK